MAEERFSTHERSDRNRIDPSGVDQQTLTLENVTRDRRGVLQTGWDARLRRGRGSEANLTVDGLTAVDPSEVIDADVLGALEQSVERIDAAGVCSGPRRPGAYARATSPAAVRRIDAGSLRRRPSAAVMGRP